jgi:hypothetical protein
MVVSAGTAINQQIDTAGSMVTNKIKLLGLDTTNPADGLEPNFVAICEKIPTTIMFWERFSLDFTWQDCCSENFVDSANKLPWLFYRPLKGYSSQITHYN